MRRAAVYSLITLLLVSLFTSLAIVASATTCPTFLLLWGNAGISSAAAGKFSYPTGIVTDAQGDVFVNDNGNHRVQKFDGQGNLLAAWGADDGYSLAMDDRQGILYVPLPNSGAVGMFDVQGSSLGGIAAPAGPGALAVYLTLSASGELFVNGGDRVLVFDRTHRPERTWLFPDGSPGARGIAVGPDGNLYVASASTAQVLSYDPTGHYLASFALPAGSLPYGLSCDLAGHLWVAVPNKDHVYEYTTTGTLLCTLGGTVRSLPGYLSQPYGVTVSASGDVYTCDHGFMRVERFTGGVTPVRRATWGSLKSFER